MVFKNGVKHFVFFCVSSLHVKSSDESLIDFLIMINSYCLFLVNWKLIHMVSIVIPQNNHSTKTISPHYANSKLEC